ncbi:MAG: serine-type D-Ala-D-Ala carboxypeptidase [Gammaproteobacteria bacterium 39-13]|nr:D-alanyl-D-alanine carboxypeptidase [Gammaproteobacteria bacterium]OJV96016.1 MAG: serine-type D-Ala-D-Ala carboxypeptidase [Gammaproteobacteria bacterium 39-13]
MHRTAFRWISFLCLIILSPLGLAANTTVPAAPELEAEAYILVDFRSGKTLAAKDADKRIDPASLTKMMTVYVFDHELQNGKFKLEDEVTISENAWKTEGSRMFVPVGKKIQIKDLLRGIIIQSGNDATVALAEFVAGSESAFADLMNQYAQKLGMTSTHFANSTGIPNPDHYTTARDLSLLANALITQFPETYKIYSEKWFTFNGIKQPNRNRLLWREPYIDGIKTGHSSTAGYCLAASGQKDNMRLISILVGSKTEAERTEQTLQLLRYGFRFFETHHLFQANTALNEPRVWMGDRKKLALGITRDLYITIPQGQYKSLDAKMNIDKNLTAPITKGDNHGKLVVKLGDDLIAEMPLVALENVDKGTMWDRFSDYVSLGFHKILNNPQDEATKSS